MKKAFIIHGWGADSKSDWIPWLKKELEKKNFEVFAPDMPDTDEPIIEDWLNSLEELLADLDEDSILIGHSIGCQAIMRHLERLEDKIVDKIIFVAPWFNLKGLEDDEWGIAKPWIETKIDFDKLKKSNQELICLFSDNDTFVSIENEKLFKENLDAKTIVLKDRGHFIADEGITEIPEILEFV